MVATKLQQREINVGDVVDIEACERYWHGVKADTTMGQITTTLAGCCAERSPRCEQKWASNCITGYR
jgi:hypothetical protein